MIFAFAVAICIVYGLTLLIVQGTVFDSLKKRLGTYIDLLDARIHPSDEDVLKLVETSHISIPTGLLALYKELTDKVATANENHKNFDNLLKLYNDTWESIKNEVYKQRRHFYLTQAQVWIAKKIKKLWSCMMCMSFWIGMGVPILALLYPMTFFGVPFVILASHNSLVSNIIGTIIMGAFFSGTTWSIHCIVDMCDEIKNYMSRK